MEAKKILSQYEEAKARYAEYGVETDKALEVRGSTEISMH